MSGPTELPYAGTAISPGNRRLVGNEQARDQVKRIISSGRLSHAYLISGPQGVGKKALALTLAELINGIDNLTDLQGLAFSKKSRWSNHPDIGIFIPLPGSDPDISMLSERTQLLAKDPYEVVDFTLRPSVKDDSDQTNKNAFYSISYFKETVLRSAYRKPNEGNRNIIIISEVEKMRKEASNTFLKLLEEPPPGVVFILTSNNVNALLPTIISRCQHIQMAPLKPDEVAQGLQQFDKVPENDARFLSRITNGNYASARFYDTEQLRAMRNEIITYLRACYTLDPAELIDIAGRWQKENNREGMANILNLMEVLVRDLEVYRSTGEERFLVNADQIKVIHNFCKALKNARLDEMQLMFEEFRNMLGVNVTGRYIFIVLAFRLSRLMRGKDPEIPESKPWLHIPAYKHLAT
ncbi:DNA polymerase-3 subunit delta' [Cyclonatronum proteinivorum]|uniref:DNA polymerase III subunit delta' n=1 Tax=Cyclonatronum proteinivorum TaxID=1457365 RepID=A0A345UMC6_9BACT|nr:AAA family ATPase [Cyclonatronum proteinivorum]AXJ01628.1 DNA polymerase-3 subunit delta' [Cyclonatronum proteinivorum]